MDFCFISSFGLDLFGYSEVMHFFITRPVFVSAFSKAKFWNFLIVNILSLLILIAIFSFIGF